MSQYENVHVTNMSHCINYFKNEYAGRSETKKSRWWPWKTVRNQLTRKRGGMNNNIPTTRPVNGKRNTGSELRKEIEEFLLCMREAKFVPQANAAHVDRPDGLSGDVGDLLGGHIEFKEGGKSAFIDG